MLFIMMLFVFLFYYDGSWALHSKFATPIIICNVKLKQFGCPLSQQHKQSSKRHIANVKEFFVNSVFYLSSTAVPLGQ